VYYYLVGNSLAQQFFAVDQSTGVITVRSDLRTDQTTQSYTVNFIMFLHVINIVHFYNQIFM